MDKNLLNVSNKKRLTKQCIYFDPAGKIIGLEGWRLAVILLASSQKTSSTNIKATLLLTAFMNPLNLVFRRHYHRRQILNMPLTIMS